MSVARRRLKFRWGEVGLNILRSEKKNCAFWFLCVCEKWTKSIGLVPGVRYDQLQEQNWLLCTSGLFCFVLFCCCFLSKRIIFEIEHIEQMSTRRNWSWSGRKMSGRVAFYFTFKAKGSDELWAFPGGWRNPCWYLWVALKERSARRLEMGKCFNFLNGVKSRIRKETIKQITKWRWKLGASSVSPCSVAWFQQGVCIRLDHLRMCPLST